MAKNKRAVRRRKLKKLRNIKRNNTSKGRYSWQPTEATPANI